jgi:5-methylcytosine-specific restriction endonuclease McrBC regulatory subunit McrC
MTSYARAKREALPSIAFQAAPRRDRCGIALVSGRGARLLIAVLPKAWAGRDHSVRSVRWEQQQAELRVVLHEGDTCVIELSSERRALVEEALLQSRNSEHSQDPEGSGGLLIPTAARSTDSIAPPLPESPVGALLDLARRLGQLSISKSDLGAMASHQDELRVLLHLRFAEEVELQLRRVRRAYVEAEGDLGVIRGRISSRSLVATLALGEPRVHCTFDEFTHRTPLLEVIATALDVAARGVPPGLLATRNLIQDSIDRSVRIRRELADVPSRTRRDAVTIGHRLRLDRLSEHWSQALELAIAVLTQVELLPDPSGEQRVRGFELKISTARLWEETLGAALHAMSGTDRSVSIAHVDTTLAPSPWRPDPGSPGARYSRPDFLLRIGAHPNDRVWCLDAKYKLLAKSAAPDRSDQYQIFAYSHLVQISGPGNQEVSDAALLYAGSVDEPARVLASYKRERSSKRVPLVVVRLPFPTASIVGNDALWNDYLAKLGSDLLDVVAR